jgi:hypothetical protein
VDDDLFPSNRTLTLLAVLTASDDRARLVGETHTSHRSECSHPNTIANREIWLHATPKLQ